MNQNKSPILYKHTHTQGGSNRAALRFWNRRVELQHHMDLNLLTRVYLEMEFFFFSDEFSEFIHHNNWIKYQ